MSDDSELSEDDLVELSLLRDFETDELIKAGFLSEDEQLRAPLSREITFKQDELDLCVTAGPCYPAVPVTWMIENHTMPRQVVDELRAQLRRIVEAAAVTNSISKWKRREENAFGVFEPTMVVLELAKKTATSLDAWRRNVSERRSVQPVDKSYLPFKTKQVNQILTISDVAKLYLQETPQEICSRIPSNYRILHVEEVIRFDLAREFHVKQEEMRAKLTKQPYGALLRGVPPAQQSRRKEVLVEHLVTPKVTFHGTARQFVPSIVRYGFLKPGKRNPGTNEVHNIRCGATYGRGIYSSPDPDFSLSYTGDTCHATKPNEFFGIKLIVCATLMGRSANISRADNWREQTVPYPGADSHVANRGLEYIVFDTAQILPVYVIHIDWGQDNAAHFMDLPSDPGNFVPTRKKRHAKLLDNIRWPGDIQRERAAALARAAKWFPYGYGPSTGSKFVVEEIGDVDEDEEEYGDYQELRGEDINDKTNLDFWSWVKVGVEMDMAESGEPSVDEYTRQRHWHGPESSKMTAAWDDLPDPRVNDQEEEDGHAKRDEDDDLGLGLLML
ncbi:hypothetical protein F5Y06DRAFT_262021 [Hypoxylon sp. FL0890]|nr:hypothetical protein F5Y06DRAFT_262021 [Hypoxylon sp. FL0890]